MGSVCRAFTDSGVALLFRLVTDEPGVLSFYERVDTSLGADSPIDLIDDAASEARRVVGAGNPQLTHNPSSGFLEGQVPGLPDHGS